MDSRQTTVTLERRVVQGTGLMMIEMHYKGTLIQLDGLGYACFKARSDKLEHVLTDKISSITELRQAAREKGFTHMRISGDWTGVTKPKGGRLAPV